MSFLTRYIFILAAVLFLLPGCTLLPDPKPQAQDKYLLEYSASGSVTDIGENIPVMIVTLPRAHGGYDSLRIAYKKQQFGLRYYVKSRWADTPARMLAPLITEAMNETGSFLALYATPGAVTARYRLDTELINFYQDFTSQPSEAHVTLRAQLVNLNGNRVMATRLFDVREAASSEDTFGGVQAANRATARLVGELAQFCVSRINR